MKRRWAVRGIPGVAAAIIVTERKCEATYCAESSCSCNTAASARPAGRVAGWGLLLLHSGGRLAASCQQHAERVVYGLARRVIVRCAHPATRFTAQGK